MGRSEQSDRRLLLASVAMAAAGGAMFTRLLQGDGSAWTWISALGALTVVVISALAVSETRTSVNGCGLSH